MYQFSERQWGTVKTGFAIDRFPDAIHISDVGLYPCGIHDDIPNDFLPRPRFSL